MKTIRTALSHRWSLLFLLLILSPLIWQFGCKEDKKEDEEKTEESASSETPPEAKAPAGENAVEKPAEPQTSVGEKVVEKTAKPQPPAGTDDTTGLMTKGPAKINLGTAALAIPTVAKQHGFFQAKPVLESGLSEIVLNALPADVKQEWKSTVEDLGFNPLEAIEGGVLWSNGDAYDKLGEPGADTYMIVVGKNGFLSTAIIEVLKDLPKDAINTFDGPHATGYFCDSMSPAQIAEARSLLVSTFKQASPDVATFDHAYDDSHILIGRTNKNVIDCYYLSPNGIVQTKLEGSTKEDVTAKLATFFKRINAAADLKSHPRDFSDKRALNVHLTRKNEVIDGRLDLSNNIDLSLSVPKESVDLPGDAEKFIAGWNLIKLAPDTFLSGADIPAKMRPMIIKLIKSTDLSIDRGTINARVNIPVADVKEGLADLIR